MRVAGHGGVKLSVSGPMKEEMRGSMGLGKKVMKVVIKVRDVVQLARRFEQSPTEAMAEMVEQVQLGFKLALERIMDAEIALFLGCPEGKGNKRNGYRTRTYAVKGVGTVQLRVPRDRNGQFRSKVVPSNRHYDQGVERDITLLNLAGLSTRMLSLMSKRLLGIKVSPQEVSNAMHVILPAAKAFLERPLNDRKFKYLYVDGTNFKVRRTTVALEPVLVVVGVDEQDRKSVIAMIEGAKEDKNAWQMAFDDLKHRGMDPSCVELGIMDGLPGLMDAFREAFVRARVARCWVHKSRNVLPRVPKRYQNAFRDDWNAVQYASSKGEAKIAYEALEKRWSTVCDGAVDCMRKDLDALLTHYDFPKEHWDALRTTNPIERVNKEFKRRSKSMEVVSPAALKGLLAFTAMRLEYGWITAPITAMKQSLKNLSKSRDADDNKQLAVLEEQLLN